MGPCGKAAAGHEESNHTSGCSYFALLISESGWARSAGFSWINLRSSGCTGASHTRGQDANDTQSINKSVKQSAKRMYWVLNGHLGHGRDCVGFARQIFGASQCVLPDVGWSRQVAQNDRTYTCGHFALLFIFNRPREVSRLAPNICRAKT